MDQISAWLQNSLGIGPEDQGRLFASLIAILLLWIIYEVAVWGLIKRIRDLRLRYQTHKTAKYFFFVLAFLIIGRIWFEGISSLATFLGLLSAGIAIALKDPLVNLLGWGYIISRRPFDVGDRIQIGEAAGDVIDRGLFHFSLMEVGNWVEADQSTGRILHVPNGLVFSTITANYMKGYRYIWNEVPVMVSFDSDWEKAKQMLQKIAEEVAGAFDQEIEKQVRNLSETYLVQYGKLTPTVYTSIKDDGILLTIRYLCEPRQRRDSTQAIWESVLRAFAAEEDIRLGYPGNVQKTTSPDQVA